MTKQKSVFKCFMMMTACLASISAGGQAMALSLPVANASFEQTPTSYQNSSLGLLGPSSGSVPGWTWHRSGVIMPGIGVRTSSQATDGTRVAAIDFGVNVLGSGFFRQDLNVLWESNTIYTFSVDIGTPTFLLSVDLLNCVFVNLRGTASGAPIVAGTQSGGLLGVELLGIDIISIPQHDDIGQLQIQFSTGDINSAELGNIRIEMGAGGLLNVLSSVVFDNVKFDAEPIPEPNTVILAGLAACSLLTRRFRKNMDITDITN